MKVRWTSTEDDQHPVGWEVDDPNAFRLCELGLAEPVDDEAKAKWAEREKYLEKMRNNLRRQAEEQVAKAAAEHEAAEAVRHADFERMLMEK